MVGFKFPKRRLSNCSSVSAGLRSICSTSSFFSSVFPTILLALKITGPGYSVMREQHFAKFIIKLFFPICNMDFDIFEGKSLRSFAYLFYFLEQEMGKSSVTLWPQFLAKRYPSPVEPVEGYEIPPVATTTASAVIFFPLASRTPFISLSLLINNSFTSQ